MRFWDSSAILPLLLREPMSARARGWIEEDASVVVWWGTRVECWSAVARLRRQEVITIAEESSTIASLAVLHASWNEVLPREGVRDRAGRLLRTHALRAADALQLAAALVWAEDRSGAELVTLDERLAVAATLEGFSVLS